MKIDDDAPYEQLDDSMNFFTVDGTDGFFIDSPQFQQPIRVSTDLMKGWSAAMDQRKKFAEIEEKAQGELFDQWLEKQETLRNAQPLIFN